MVKKPEVLAIIPARGGSKGIPRKNIREFAGFPLLTYSILAGLRSKYVSRVLVSTDDEEIAGIARQWGAEVPFLRPQELAQDHTTDMPVLVHCLDWLKNHGDYIPDIVTWLRPTSPVRPKTCVDDAVELLLKHPEGDSVRGVVPAGQNPFKMWTMDDFTGQLNPLVTLDGIKEPYNAPRQVLPDVYWQTGHIDAIWIKTIREKQSMTGDSLIPLLLDSKYTVDIDLPEDWQMAEERFLINQADVVDPASRRRVFPEEIEMILLDFDGVLTDDRVWVSDTGQEMVAASRADGLGLEQLKDKTGIPVMVISRETNPVVKHRCQKLNLPVLQAILEKDKAVREVVGEKNLDPSSVIFMGNDVNDIVVFGEVGFAIAPADAHPEVLRRADLVLSKDGGKGAVRELCDLILSRLKGDL
ncbi:MAG: Putative N-acylneuraminate cytidylyltransferase [Anaerolinea thermophila]|uniref:3-deoxy-D-manno-octulosonate 8-phosphate phosphatase KdsC n=1 Tax=Anaerolinea thermophila TaxID=167964 RepID=A0A101FX89_9CHLR|nr:MAG: Putative N-acylneuraminate cytidylyltransferase [Anaerolinea thermophila]